MASLDELLDTEDRPRRRKGLNWPRLAERILGRLAPTLHQAMVAVSLFIAGLACLVAVWGGYGVVCVIMLCVLLHRALTKLRSPAPA